MKRRVFLKLAGAASLLASSSVLFLDKVLVPFRALAAPGSAAGRKVICLGLDGMDPLLLQRFVDEGVLPTFARLMAEGDFRVFGTSTPPQSPVAWSNFITGQDPGGHGIFDFIHRDPVTLTPFLSISEAKAPSEFWQLAGWKYPRDGGEISLLRQGRAFWEYLAEAGIDVTMFKVPSNFPPVECDARSLSGMGTPDILGTYGIFSYYTDDPPANLDIGGGRIIPVTVADGRFSADILGPVNSYREGDPESAVTFSAVVDQVNPAVLFRVDDTSFILQEGEWSDWITLHYVMIPGLKDVTGTCRFLLKSVRPFRLYVTPVQIDPANPEMPICTPPEYSRELVDKTGLYYTQGLPDDTKALDEGIFDDGDYVSQADLVLEERLHQFHYELARFRGLDSGFLFFYFNSLDQNSHMFWRNMDPESPLHAAAGGLYPDRIRDMYIAMDEVLAESVANLEKNTTLFAISDHGFAPFHRNFHVNSWLRENGYLAVKQGVRPETVAYLSGIDWQRTRAYAFGINGLYVNLRGRERYGSVSRGVEREELLDELVAKLEAVVDHENGRPVIRHAYRCDKEYRGPHAADGPDLILGYYRGFRGSNDSALGRINESVFDDNRNKWSGCHCMAADEVPGILVCNRKLAVADPNLLDMAPTFLRLFDLVPTPEMRGRDLFAPDLGGEAG
ncbi:MAG: alkaline phosphatase family protein [bacterium]